MDRNQDRSREPAALSEEEFLQHGGFLERLARSLVGDEHESQDLVQGAWTTALASPRREPGSLRSWLATIVRNTASNLHRDRDRRVDRERVAARPEHEFPEPTVDDQLEVQAKVVTDPALIGGLVAKIGDTVFDGSVKSRFADVREQWG